MSAEVTDVSSIQDEDLLRRMWQQTEDFGRKKEIRARMYKLREQRLKEFYTTGEVLSDVLSTSTSSLDEGRRNVNKSNLQSSQSSSSQIITKSSYAGSSSRGGYNITHADSLADEGFLTLKTKEIRDSESPTREFHQRQEKNAKNESSSSGASAGGGYWRIAQESSSGAYESTGTTGEGGEMIIHTASKNESRSLAADSKNEGFTTATQVTSSEHTQRRPQPDSGIQLDGTADKSVIPTNSREDTSARNVASSAQIYSENLSSSSSASYSASRSQQYQQNEEKLAVTSSTAMSHENSQAVSGLEGTNVTVSESTKFSSPTSATQDVISSSTTASTQIINNQTSKHRVTQRSQTGELVSKTIQSTSGTSDIKSPAIEQPSSTVTVTSSSLTEDGSRSSTKISDQHTVKELHNLDSILCTQNMAVTATPVDLGDTRDSSNWTVVSSDKIQNVNNATDEFVFCSGLITEDKKDSTTKHDTKFIEQERTSSVVNRHYIREPEDAAPRNADEKTSTITNKDKADLQSLISEAPEIPKRGVPTQDTTIGKDGTNTTGQYVTTYQEAYTNKRISVDLSPTHEAFARSLRASPERPTPPSSTRSSSKASLDHPSPDRFNKSPTRSYRNKTSPDNTLASGRTSPDKTPRSKTPPVRATAEKITNKASPRHSSPEKTTVHRSPPSRVSPEKTSRHPDGTSPSRSSPEKLTQSSYSHRRESLEKTGKSSATDSRKTSEIATKISEKEGSPSLASPDKITRPSHAETTPSLKTSPENQQQDKTLNVPEKNFSYSDKPHDISSNAATRKTSDSLKTYSSVSNRDSTVKAKTTREKRKLSSGLSRATTKKRSSTPGVSPSSSPTRDDEARLSERQSRPRSRGTPSRSSTDSEDNDSNVKAQKLENEFEAGDNISKTIVQTTTTDSETNIKRTEFGKRNIESYTTDEKKATALSSEIDKRTGGQTPKGEKTVADSSPRKSDEPREFVPEDSDLERVKTKSPLLSTVDRASDKCSNVTSLSREVTSEGAINAKKIKHADSASISAKTNKNKSSDRDSYGITERSTSPQKIMPDDVGTNVLPRSQESGNSSPSSSPIAVSPTTHSPSSKSVMDRLPRDKSPEYSSEGSLVNELYLKRSTTDVATKVSSPVKLPRDVRKDSPDSSPDRGSFKPIKCFRTSPEIRPSTLEFAHPEKHAPLKASPEKIKSPTKPFKSKTVDDATKNLESVIGEAVNPLGQPRTRGEPIFSTNVDFKMSPKRPNASPAFENDDFRATSTKIEADIFNTVPLAAKDTSFDATKGNICESENEQDQTIEFAKVKRTPYDQTRIYQEDLGTTTTNGTSEKVLSGYVFEKPSKLPKKAEKGTPEDVYDENEQLQDSARKSRTQDSYVDKTVVQQCTESKSSNISPRSSSPDKSSATRIAKITVKLTSPLKKYSPQDKKLKSTGNTPSPSRVILSSSQQYQSDSSPERDSLKGRKVPKRSHPEKSDDTEPSKYTCVSNRISTTSATPDKSIRKKSDRSVPLPSQSPDNPKLVSQPSREKPTSKVLESKGGDQIPARDHSAAQTPKRASRKASPSPHSSPERTSPNITVRKKYDSSPDSRQSPTPSPERVNDREIHPKTVAKSPKRVPSPSPERHRIAEKKSPAVKPSTKRISALPDHYSPSSSPEKRSRIPGRCIRDSPNQSPARSSEPTAKYSQNISRPGQSPVYPVQKTGPNFSPARTKQSPARPSEQNARINEASARVIQSRAHSSPVPSGYKCETVKPKKSGPDAAPIKSALVTTFSKPRDSTELSRTHTEPSHTSDRYPRQGSPTKQCTRLSPSKKGYPAAKEPKQNTPGEVDDEVSTDRSSTVSSPETVKTAGDSTALDAAELVNNKVTSQKITAASHKRTEMYIPQLTCDRGSPPSGDAQGDKLFSLSTLKGIAETKTDEIAATMTVSVTSGSKGQEDILESQHHKEYYNQNYTVDDIRDETPPDEFLVEDDSPYESPVQPYSYSRKAQKFPADFVSVQQTRMASKSKMTENTSTCKYDRTTTVTTKISQKSARNQSRTQKQEPHSPGKEKTITPTVQSKYRPRTATTADVKITRSSSDKNVTRKETSSPGNIKPRRLTSKPEMTDSRATITRNISSTRQPQATVTVTTTTIRTTKIPTQSVKPAVTKVLYTTEQKRSKDMSKSTVTTAARNRIVDKNQKFEIRNIKQTKEKLANGIVQKPQTSSSEDEEEVLKTFTLDEKETTLIEMSDEHDQTYVRELDEIRRTDEEQYASKITEVRTSEDRLHSPSQNISGVIIQPLRSSRESSPEYPRGTVDNVNKPRYADRISEPEDDDELPRQYKQKNVFRKPTIHPESVDEEYTNEDSKPKTERLVESSQPKELPRYIVPCAEQVTDLFDKSETEQAPKSVSVADRISHFLETTRNVLSSVVPSEPGKPIESSPTPLDSPSTVRRARAMFETIAVSQTTPHKDFTQLKDAEAYRECPKESTLPGIRKPENQRQPRYTSPFTEEQLPDRHDTLSTTPGTKYSVKKSLINEYPIDEGKGSPCYKESYPVRISDDAEKPRIPSADTRIHHKSPSPERLGLGEPAYTQPRSKSPISTFPHDKKSATSDSLVNRNYNTYTKVKPSKDVTPGTKPVVTEPGTSRTVYDIETTDAPLVDKSPHKDHPVKEFSQRDSSEHKESSLTMNDSELTSGERTDSKQEDSFCTRDESKPKEVEAKDVYPIKKSLREDFPEDTLIRAFTEDTTTQRETLRQKDIVNRPSVFEARRLGHKVAPSKRQEEFKHSYESKTSGFPETHPSKDDMLTIDDINYSIDTLTKASPTRKKSYPQGESPREGSPKRKSPSPKDTSPTRKDPCPKLESPRVSSPTKKHPSPKDASPTRKDSYPKVETPRDGSSTRKHSSSKDTSPTARDSYQKVESPTRKHPSPKDTSPKRKDSYPKAESPRDSSPTSKHYSPKDTSPTRKDSYPKAESPRDSSPTRKHPPPKDTSPKRKDSYPKAESPRDSSPARKHPSPKDTSPTRKDSYPKAESPRDSFPARKHPSPKDTSPKRKDSYPKAESPRESSPIRKHPSPKDTSPTRKDSYPKAESPRDSSPGRKHQSPKDTSPKRKDSHPKAESPRDSSPARKHPSPKDTSPTRMDSYPKAVSPRESSPTRKYPSPKDTSPTRKDSYPKAESPRESSPARKHPSPKDTSPTRKDSYPKAESPRESSPARKHPSPKDTSPIRKDSSSRRVTCNVSSARMQRSSSKDESPRRKVSSPADETPREFSPTRGYTVPTDTSPTEDKSHPIFKDKITDNRYSTDSSHISQDIIPKRISVTRPETKPGTPRKDSQSNQYSPKQEPKPLETGALRSSGRFGVNLRRTGSTVGSTVQRRLSGESSKTVTTLNKKGDETRIEDIFDLELLESMLEKAVGYEQRRSIRAQIRIVRRLLAERSAVTVKSEGKPEHLIGGDVTQFVDNNGQDGGFSRHQDDVVEKKMSSTRQEFGGLDGVSFDRRPDDDDDDDDDDSYQKPSSVSQKPCPETREETSPDVQDSKPPASRSESYSTFPRDSKPATEKIPDRKSSPARKSSKSELNIELKPAAPSPVKSPIKKSSLGELPREAFPTDSVTSSYGVGPTDENGRPLFGLSALRRRQSANSNIQIPQDAADSAPASELEPEDKPQEVESKPSEICDSSGRPFFGGLRALKATTTTTSKGSSTPQDEDKAPSTENINMREQRVSSHLRELVTKHEQTSRGNAISQPTAPRQKPRAKLRDSFIQRSQDSESEKRSAEELTDARVMSQRVNSLKAIIQKHEKIVQDETRCDRVPSSDGDIPDAGDTDISCRPGILKKVHGADQVITESTSTSSTTVISSRGILKPDGTVSLKRDIIQGETVSRLGEAPVTRITRNQYTYSTPEDKSTVASSYDCDLSDSTRKSSTSSRRSSSGKTPSPERGHLDGDVKLSRINTSAVTSSDSFRKSKMSEEDRSKYDKIRSTATHDDISRGSKVTTERKSEEDEKFLSSATAFLSQQKMTDENCGILSSSSLEKESIAKTDNETRFSTLRDGKYTSSTTATITRTTPVSVHDDFDDTRKTSASGYGNYSRTTFSRSEAGKEVTSYLLDSERSTCSSESRRLQHSDDDDESDGYRHVPRTVTESDTPRASRRYSTEADTDGQVQRSEVSYSSSSSLTQNHSAATTAVETTTSQSSTPKQIIESVRRRSSAASDIDRDASPVPSTGSSGFSRVARGGSVRALSQKFQQAAAEANSGDSTHSQRSYPKAGLIFRSSSFRLNNCTSPATTPTGEEAPGSANLKQSMYEDVHSRSTPTGTCRTPSAETEGKSFLTNQTHVTGVQDVITRMKNADQDVKAGDSEEDAEARSLLNKFLGAQVMLQGMDPLVKASQSQSAALVSQVERQRVLASQKTATALTSHKDSEQDLEEIWDEKLLRELLDKCSDYEGRRKIRARLRVVMAEQKACASVVAAALADGKIASEREQVEMGDVLHHSIEEGESLLLPLLVEQLRSSLLLEKKCTGCVAPLVPPPHSHSSQSLSEERQVERVEDSGTESGEDLRLLAVGLRDSIELHLQQSCDASTQKINSTSVSTETFGPSLLLEVQTALSRLQASLQLGSIGEQGEVLDPARRDALLHLVSRLQASLQLPAPRDKANSKSDSPEILFHPPKQKNRFENKKLFRQNRHTVAVTREELDDARRVVEENAAKDRLTSNSGCFGAGGTAHRLVQQSSAGDLALPEGSVTASSVVSPVMSAFRPVHFAPRHSLPGLNSNGNTSAKPFFLPQFQNSGSLRNSQSHIENQKSNFSDMDYNSGDTAISNVNGIHRTLEESESLNSPCIMNNSALSDNNLPHCTVQKETGIHQVNQIQNQPQLDKPVSMQPITAVHREYRPGRLGNEGVRPIQKSLSLDNPNVAVQSVIALAEQAIQKVPVHSSSTSSSGSSQASTPLRSDSGNSVPEKVVHKPLSKAVSLDSSSSSKASTPQSSDSGTSAAERTTHKSVSQAPVPQRSDSAEGLQHRSVSQGSALSSTSSSKASTPRSDSGSSLPNRHIQKPFLSESSPPHAAAAQSVSLDNINTSVTIPQGSAPEHKAISHSVSLDSDSRDYDPSVLLFTPAQSVQIAVHKAAINKQLSIEEEKRQRMNAQSCQKTYDNDSADDDDDGSDVDSSSEDEGSSEMDEEEEEENTSTVCQAAVTEKDKREASSNHHSKNEDDRHSQIGVNCAQIRMLNSYNSKQKSAESKIWHANVDDSDKHVAVKVPETNKNVWSNSEQWTSSPVNQNPAWLDVQNINQTVQKPIQNIYAQQNNTVTETNSGNAGVDMSSAQRLLQMATKDAETVVSRSNGRTDRKVKMKRANTIDIPKPLNFYEIEEETDYSSAEEYEGERDSRSVTDSSIGHNHSTYLALRGPIRVSGGNKAFGDKVTPPTFQPKTESDHKFLTFLQQHSNGKGNMWKGEGGFSKTTGYNPAARGGQHWSSRFTNIKTAFETPAGRDGDNPGRGRNVTSSGPARARMFWQSADDSVTVVKSAAASGPKLSRQGSIFLKKLFEQKEQEQQSKLPWTEKNAVSDDSVVVGSLTVAATTGSVLSKKQLFTPPQSPATVHAPLNINKFSHAPMSAFQPIEKKEKGDTVNEPVDESVKQVATQKFTAAPKPSKQTTGLSQHTKQELLSPVSTSLPWTRESTHLNHSVLNSAVVKFEGITRETSPQPAPFARPRSHSQEKIAVPRNFSVFVKQPAPVPVPRSYVSTSHIPGSVQGRYQEQTNQVLSLNSPKQPAPIPTPPMLTAPHLIQNYDNNQQICHKEPEICKSFNQQKYEGGVGLSEQNGQEKTSEEIRQYCTKSYTTEIDYGTEEFTEFPSVSPVPQTYSGSVTSESSSIYPQSGSVFIPNSNVQQPELDSVHSPDNSLPSPEAFTAVSRIMTGPTSHQAVTVTHRTRHRYDDMDEEVSGRSSAAKNLASVLIKFSSASENNRNLQSVPKQQSSKSPTSALRNKEEDAIQSLKQNTSVYSSKKSPTVDTLRQDPRESQPHHPHQHHSFAKQSQKETKSLTSTMNRHHSEPDIASMISDDQFAHHQQELKMKAAEDTNYFRSPVYQNHGISKAMGYPHCSDGLARGLGKFTHAGSVPGLAEESYRLPSVSARVRPASTESLITATSTEELQESGESVLTTRLQIPVYSNSNKLHNLAQSFHNAPRSSSLHDVSDTHTPSKNTFTSSNPSSSVSPSLTLRKSGSWHQLVAGQQGIRNKRPQSLALPDLTVPNSNVHRIPPALPKTKSSHSLSFPKQFEAALSPESVENKQRKVEAYLNISSKPKTQEVKMKVQGQQDNFVPPASDMLILDDNLENVDEAFENVFNATISSNIESKSKRNTAHKTKRQLRQPATEELSPSHLSGSSSSQFVRKQQAWEESSSVRTKLAQHLSRHSESKVTSSSTDGSTVTHTEVTTKTSSISTTSVGKGRVPKAPSGKAMSPFAKFQQLDRQSSSQSTPSSPKTPGGTTAAPLFKFTDPQLSRSASGVKDRLLFWCQCKTKEYKNIQIDNFSTSWSNGLAFCALIHHFLPDAFEYDSLRPEERRKNFELAFRVADEKAGIAPLLDVEDMVIMRKPDWKCVFTYVQSVYRRFKDQD